jgi:hypothetical protein
MVRRRRNTPMDVTQLPFNLLIGLEAARTDLGAMFRLY